jgi:peroxiredoxin Q/BCP
MQHDGRSARTRFRPAGDRQPDLLPVPGPRQPPWSCYFYPKDNTPGCTTEAGEFRELHAQFRRAGCAVYGISRDSLKSHEGFKAKLTLPFELLSDADETACTLFGVIRQKVLYGKPVRGIERSTFVIDAEGVLRREWRGVKAPGHAAEVLEFVQSLKRDK